MQCLVTFFKVTFLSTLHDIVFHQLISFLYQTCGIKRCIHPIVQIRNCGRERLSNLTKFSIMLVYDRTKVWTEIFWFLSSAVLLVPSGPVETLNLWDIQKNKRNEFFWDSHTWYPCYFLIQLALIMNILLSFNLIYIWH